MESKDVDILETPARKCDECADTDDGVRTRINMKGRPVLCDGCFQEVLER
jgi:hypothetical protein